MLPPSGAAPARPDAAAGTLAMRIAYLAPAWPPSGVANGIVTYVAAMRRQLSAEGHDVSVVTWNRLYAADGREHDLASPPTRPGLWKRLQRRVDHRRGERPFAAIELARQLRRARALASFDVIEMEESFGWSRAAQRGLDIPVVTRLHGPEFLKPPCEGPALERVRSRQRAAAEGRAIGGAGAISAPTAATLAFTRSHYRHPLAGSAVIPNPVGAHDDALRRRVEREPGLVLFVGRFDYGKGADTMLDAFASVAAARRDVRLIMVGPDAGLRIPGGGLIGFADYAARYLPPEVRARIEFTGTLPPDRIGELRRRAALTVVASRAESFSFAAVEAMAAASPVICTDWAGSSDVIADGVTGWLTPVGDADRLAARIAWVADHPDAAERVGAAAWRRCREAYSPEEVSRRSVDFYGDVLARHVVPR